MTLKYRFGITQYHWKWHQSKAWVVSYLPSIVTTALSHIILETK